MKAPLQALRHRGPDGSGVFVDRALDVALGHTRLSIIDLVTGAQPLFSEDRAMSASASGLHVALTPAVARS